MSPKKPAGKKLARSRTSLSSRLLVSRLGGSTPAPQPEEPWRNTRTKGRHGGSRRK